MRIDLVGRRCALCGGQPVGRIEVSLRCEITCARHTILGRCVFCGLPYEDARPPGWDAFCSEMLRCPTCQRGAVDTQDHARQLLPAIRCDMASIQIILPTRVLVRLVEPAGLAPGRQPVTGGVLLGVTEHVLYASDRREVVEIRIARGQPPLQFGRAVAHEMGHAWLVQHGTGRLDPPLEEGLCELFAHAWLKRRTDPIATELRARLRDNPDPVYGAGFRTVAAATQRHGVAAVLTSLAGRSILPS
jgi:hypothetical protein